MDYKIASAATKWWIDQIKMRCQELYPNKVIIDNSNIVIIDNSLKSELSRFEELLFAQILGHLENKLFLSLTCYFWPSGDLGSLVRKAKISKEIFPCRAQMQIYEKNIWISLNGENLRQLPLPKQNCNH